MNHLDTGAMCGQENNLNNVKEEAKIYLSTCGRISHKISFGMAYEPAQEKYGAILRITSHIFHIIPSFKPWSLEIPISDGYHEYLCLDICHL